MSRFIDTLFKLYDIYYRDLYNNIENYYRIKLTNYTETNNNTQYLHNVISAFNNDYTFDNYCCCCLNPKQNDVFIKINCGHEMHYYCYSLFIKNKYNLCPFCKTKITNKDNKDDKDDIKTFDNNNFKYEINELYYK
jgi:hypothetical protein